MSRRNKECKALDLFFMSLGFSLVATGLVVACKKLHGPRIPMEEYRTRIARIAAMDDRICRHELEGNIINGKPIEFPPLEESIKHRYRYFYKKFRKHTKEQLEAEYEKFKERLNESMQHDVNKPVDLSVQFI